RRLIRKWRVRRLPGPLVGSRHVRPRNGNVDHGAALWLGRGLLIAGRSSELAVAGSRGAQSRREEATVGGEARAAAGRVAAAQGQSFSALCEVPHFDDSILAASCQRLASFQAAQAPHRLGVAPERGLLLAVRNRGDTQQRLAVGGDVRCRDSPIAAGEESASLRPEYHAHYALAGSGGRQGDSGGQPARIRVPEGNGRVAIG